MACNYKANHSAACSERQRKSEIQALLKDSDIVSMHVEQEGEIAYEPEESSRKVRVVPIPSKPMQWQVQDHNIKGHVQFEALGER